MKYAITIESDNEETLAILMSETSRWLESLAARVLERQEDPEECTGSFIAESDRDLSELADGWGKELPGRMSVEPL